jgi:hypothetical protein
MEKVELRSRKSSPDWLVVLFSNSIVDLVGGRNFPGI